MSRTAWKAKDRSGLGAPHWVADAPPGAPPRDPDADARLPLRLCVLIIGVASLGLWGAIALLIRTFT